MAAGLPVISLDGGGNRDLIEEGKNGYMIFEENPTSFLEKILLLRDHPQEYQRMSQYAQNFAARFDIKSYVSKLLALYTA
jgi:spore coat protein SA